MTAHRMYLPDLLPTQGGELVIEGPEAHHAATVKRLRVGQRVEVLNGAGTIASATAASIHRGGRHGTRLTLALDTVRRVEATMPRVTVISPMPGGDRTTSMIDQLAQIGVARWQPLVCERSISDRHKPGRRDDRLERACVEACKQSGRAWLMELGGPIALAEAFDAEPDETILLADGSGDNFEPVLSNAVRIVVGPAGGFTDQERELARTSGVAATRLGPHVLRLETACVVAAGVVLATAH